MADCTVCSISIRTVRCTAISVPDSARGRSAHPTGARATLRLTLLHYLI